MRRPLPRTAWLLGNTVALVAFVAIAAHWWVDGDLDRAGRARGLAAYLNAASALPILLLSQLGRLFILALAGVVHVAGGVRVVWARDWIGLAMVAGTFACWVVAALVAGVKLL